MWPVRVPLVVSPVAVCSGNRPADSLEAVPEETSTADLPFNVRSPSPLPRALALTDVYLHRRPCHCVSSR